MLHLCFVDLEKAYDRVDRKGVWEVLRMYGVGRRNVEAVKSFYDGWEACWRAENKESKLVRMYGSLTCKWMR